jgi:hypothetical protein
MLAAALAGRLVRHCGMPARPGIASAVVAPPPARVEPRATPQAPRPRLELGLERAYLRNHAHIPAKPRH